LGVAAGSFAGMLWARSALDLVGSPTTTQCTWGWIAFWAGRLALVLFPLVLGWRSRARLWPGIGAALAAVGGILVVSLAADILDLEDQGVWLSLVAASGVAVATLVVFLAAFGFRRALRQRRTGILILWSGLGLVAATALCKAAYMAMWFE
jgi:hypothetical protein